MTLETIMNCVIQNEKMAIFDGGIFYELFIHSKITIS